MNKKSRHLRKSRNLRKSIKKGGANQPEQIEVTDCNETDTQTIKDNCEGDQDNVWEKGALLGEGTFGEVFSISKCTDTSDTKVLKMLKSGLSKANKEEMDRESAIMCYLNSEEGDGSEYLVTLRYSGEEGIVLDHCEKSLDKLINDFFIDEDKKKKKAISIPKEKKEKKADDILWNTMFLGDTGDNFYKPILGLIKGLEYMHKKGILHNDLASRNILVCGKVLKIADFGLSSPYLAAGSNTAIYGENIKKHIFNYDLDGNLVYGNVSFTLPPPMIKILVFCRSKGTLFVNFFNDIWAFILILIDICFKQCPLMKDSPYTAMGTFVKTSYLLGVVGRINKGDSAVVIGKKAKPYINQFKNIEGVIDFLDKMKHIIKAKSQDAPFTTYDHNMFNEKLYELIKILLAVFYKYHTNVEFMTNHKSTLMFRKIIETLGNTATNPFDATGATGAAPNPFDAPAAAAPAAAAPATAAAAATTGATAGAPNPFDAPSTAATAPAAAAPAPAAPNPFAANPFAATSTGNPFANAMTPGSKTDNPFMYTMMAPEGSVPAAPTGAVTDMDFQEEMPVTLAEYRTVNL